MEHGPLPPHERSWRHPSELAAEERRVVVSEPAPSSLRTVALASGTLGLLAIGLAVLTFTPDRLDAPVRLASPPPSDDLGSSATTLAVRHSTTTTATPATPTTSPAGTALGSDLVAALPVASTSSSSPATGRAVDPIGSTGYALLPVDPDERLERHSPVDVELPTGDLRTALTVASNDVVTLVAIDPTAGSRLAAHLPHDDDMVTVTSDHDETRTTYAALVADSEPPAAAVITDATGAVVGVCAHHHGTLTYQPLVATTADE